MCVLLRSLNTSVAKYYNRLDLFGTASSFPGTIHLKLAWDNFCSSNKVLSRWATEPPAAT